jgi:hypothetical protein
MEDELLKAAGNLLAYTPQEMLVNLVLATTLGMILSEVYKRTHKGLSYSQSFTQTIVFMTIIVAIVLMVIGSSLARAFALVGALSIIRFRTVVKDTKDISFIFGALALGMAAGTSNYILAGLSLVFICGLTILLNVTNYGAIHKSEFILRFRFDRKFDSEPYLDYINQFARQSDLLHMEPSGDGSTIMMTFDITLKEGFLAEDLAASVGTTDGTSEVVLIASKSDVDY